ncbi:hypothetical protein QUF64_11275 [Anaerolineales bacterium HSG6]|nr:hypothetical protein [Anaerolineales bacterium HSG6]MDM8531737.1 hypothetical protein [Anaerolineales bacterium HSG25]
MNGEVIGQELKKAVRIQIVTGKPKIAKRTYKRLQKNIADKDEIIRMMAHCLSVEMYDMMKNNRLFDRHNYKRLLELLPDEEAIYN